MSTFDKVVFGVALLVLVPVLLSPAGWLFAGTLALLWIVAAYGTRYALDVERGRRQGERAKMHEVRAWKDRGGDK